MEKDKEITLELDTPQKGHIKVHSHIIKDLSSGIYSSPAMCIKELINNSYDADATLVTIRIKPIDDIITITDNGDGMNAIDFDNNFAWISKSNKRNLGEFSKLDRPLIGKIGIGFIAVNEICDSLEIISSKKGQPIKLTAKIDFKEFRDQDIEVDEGLIKGSYELINSEEDSDEHYTILRLVGLTSTVREILNDKQYFSKIAKEEGKDYSKCIFKDMKDVIQRNHKNLRTFSEDNAYCRFIIDLASYLAVEYIDDAPIPHVKDKLLQEIKNYHKKLNFKVDLDGIYVKKPIYFPRKKDDPIIFKSFEKKLKVGTDILKFRGYFYAQHGMLTPRELNGVSIKVKNIAIAQHYGYDTSFMYYPNYTDQLFRNWISGEIYMIEGLESAMNIDRQSFRETHPHYLALQDFVHKFLREEFFKKLVNPMYKEEKKKRDTKKVNKSNTNKKKILKTKTIITKEIEYGKEESIPIVLLKVTNKESVIGINKKLKKVFKKKDWDQLESVFLILETSYKESNGDIKKLRKLFYQKIIDFAISSKGDKK